MMFDCIFRHGNHLVKCFLKCLHNYNFEHSVRSNRKLRSEKENMHKYALKPNIISLNVVFILLVILVWHFIGGSL
jgi:hypothetical protein